MKELRAAMKALGYDAQKEELKKIRFELDKDIGDEINFDEFMEIMTGRICKADTEKILTKLNYLMKTILDIYTKKFKKNMSRIR